MNRIPRETTTAAARAGGSVGPSSSLLLLQQRRARAAASASSRGGFTDGPGDDDLDLFSRSRRSTPVAPAPDMGMRRDESDGFNDPPKLPSISVASVKMPKAGIEDLLSGADMGKHDYDWLLTPPGTPLSGAVDQIERHSSVLPKSNAPVRSLSATKASRLSTSHIESSLPARPTRSNSAIRSSISSSQSAHFSSSSTKNSVLNTSTMSVNSIRSSTPTRPSTPTRTSTTSTRTSTTSSRPSTPKRITTASTTTKMATPVTRSGLTRPSTPVKVHPTPTASGDKTRPLHASRPSTPTSRPQISSTASSPSSSSSSAAARPRPSIIAVNSNSTPTMSRSNSRPSTPTRRATAPSTPVVSRSSSVGRVPPATRTPGPASRPSSPGPKPRAPVQPIVPADFPLDVPPNLRTKVTERPTSVGRTRPGSALTSRSNVNSEAPAPANPIRRPSSPVVSRGRLPENNPKARIHNNVVDTTPPDVQKSIVPDGALKKPAKTAIATESTGFGRTISKKSLDMALRHMDIRQGIGGIRGASLFPQSIKSAASKGHPRVAPDPVVVPARKATDTEDGYCNGNFSSNGSINDGISENSDSFASSPRRELLMARTVEPDIYESSRYDAILLKEDSKNLSWLHSVDDKSDQSPVFDHRFEPLPEPFSLT